MTEPVLTECQKGHLLPGCPFRSEIVDIKLPPDELLQEQAYLVSRGVRPFALIGTIPGVDPLELTKLYTQLLFVSTKGAQGLEPIPVVVPRRDGTCTDYGFAAKSWVVETFEWVMNNVPQPHTNRLLGLLLGYSPDAVAALDEAESGRRFQPLSRSLESESSTHRGSRADMAETCLLG